MTDSSSTKEVPQLIAYLIEEAPKLFDNFTDDTAASCHHPTPSAPITIGSASSDTSEGRLPLHQSTDSGLAGEDGSVGAMRTCSLPTAVAMKRAGMAHQSMLLTTLHRVDSSDSALVDPLTSEDHSASEEERCPLGVSAPSQSTSHREVGGGFEIYMDFSKLMDFLKFQNSRPPSPSAAKAASTRTRPQC